MNTIYAFLQDYALTIGVTSFLVMFLSSFIFSASIRATVQVVCMVLLVASVYLKGAKDERVEWERKHLEDQAKIANINKQRSDISTKAAVEAAKNRELIIENATLRNINVYLSQQDIDGCVIPSGFVRLHNESAEGKLSNASIKPNGEGARKP